MEDVLAFYEKPLSDKEPVVCVDEKPVVLYADVRPPRPCGRAEFCGAIAIIKGTARPMSFAALNPRLDAISPNLLPTAALRNSPTILWRSWLTILKPTPSIS